MSKAAKTSPHGKRMRLKIRAPHDFYGGLALIGLALVALWATSSLTGMHGFAFGPATAPQLFAVLLAIVGGLVTLTGLLVDGPQIERYAFRGPALVLVAILGFAAMIRPLGMVIATFVTFMISIMGSSEMRWVESLLAAAAMTAFCVILFNYLLQLPFQLWPTFF